MESLEEIDYITVTSLDELENLNQPEENTAGPQEIQEEPLLEQNCNKGIIT